MFDDNRSRKVILVAHCLLNQNSISDGTADCPAQFAGIIDLLMSQHVGLLQLPCPELTCLGLDRKDRHGSSRPLLEENTRIRELMSAEDNIEHLRCMAREVARHIHEYCSHGFDVLGVIGVNRSPSCGVETTTRSNEEVRGHGVFIEQISEACRERGHSLRMIGTKTSEQQESIERVRAFLSG